MTPDRFRFHHLFRNLLRRVSMLSAFHTDTPLEVDFAGLTRRSHSLAAGDLRLSWHDWKRYSSRQDTYVAMGGLLGEFTLVGPDLPLFWPYLWLGRLVHAGKGTSMGLGKIDCC